MFNPYYLVEPKVSAEHTLETTALAKCFSVLFQVEL